MKRCSILILVLPLLLMCTFPAYAGKIEDELKEAKDSSKNIDKQINDTANQKKQTEIKKNRLEQQIDNLTNEEEEKKQKLERMEGDIELLKDAYDKYGNELELARQRYEEKKELFKGRVRAMHESSVVSILDMLFRSESLIELFQKIEVMVAIAKRDGQLIDEMKAMKKDIEFKTMLRQDDQNYMVQNAKEQSQQVQKLHDTLSARGNELRTTEASLKTYENKLNELYKESNRLMAEIKKLQSQIKYAGGIMAWPLPSDHSVTSGYGMRFHPILRKNRLHTGIDIGGNYGASIVAANSGTVIYAGWSSGYGYTVIIDHGGGISTLYAHNSKILVKKGNKVKKEQIIAKVGSTGLSTGPHLHFEVRENGKPVNPLEKYLTKK